MAALFDKGTDTIGLHLRNILDEGELEPSVVTEGSSSPSSRMLRRCSPIVSVPLSKRAAICFGSARWSPVPAARPRRRSRPAPDRGRSRQPHYSDFTTGSGQAEGGTQAKSSADSASLCLLYVMYIMYNTALK